MILIDKFLHKQGVYVKQLIDKSFVLHKYFVTTSPESLHLSYATETLLVFII